MGGLLKLMEVRGRGPLSRVCWSDVHPCFLVGKSLSRILPFGFINSGFTTTLSVFLSLSCSRSQSYREAILGTDEQISAQFPVWGVVELVQTVEAAHVFWV